VGPVAAFHCGDGCSREHPTAQDLVETLKRIQRYTAEWPRELSVNLQRAFIIFANSYLAMPEATRTCYEITAVNLLVFMAWRIPRLQGVMRRHFLHDPLSGRAHTLLTSIFR
jgi:rhomboid-like protein